MCWPTTPKRASPEIARARNRPNRELATEDRFLKAPVERRAVLLERLFERVALGRSSGNGVVQVHGRLVVLGRAAS